MNETGEAFRPPQSIYVTSMCRPQHHDRPDAVLREHHLGYLAELRVSEELLACRFTRSCSMSSCSAHCCRGGVLVDITHRDLVLTKASLIVEHMEPDQEHDPSRWFDVEDEPDEDFPSGRAVNTATINGSCVFLNSDRRCVLHLAESSSPGLKPFYCRAYPIAIDHARVTLHADWCPEETQCCGPVPDGELTVFDVCADELVHLLGEAGARELHRIAPAPSRSLKQ
jgi:Fe-S-cluster containining protein